jgi:hypothetical protein
MLQLLPATVEAELAQQETKLRRSRVLQAIGVAASSWRRPRQPEL